MVYDVLTAQVTRGARVVASAGALAAAGAAAAADFQFSGSGFVDAVHYSDARAREGSTAPLVPELALKAIADVSDTLAASGRLCVGCHGIEVAQAQLEYTPSTKLNVTAGRIVVPFGDFSQRYDPAGHRTATRPLVYDMGRMPWFDDDALNFGVVPIPYVDTGALLHGQAWPLRRLQVWYGAYALMGLRGDPASDLDFHPATGSNRHNYWDVNGVPAGGGRLATTWTPAAGAWLGHVSVGGSFTAGRYDPEARFSYRAWGLDASTRLADLTLRAEYAARRNRLEPGRFAADRLDKSGWYVEAEHPAGPWVTAVARYDELRREGPLHAEIAVPISARTAIRRWTAGVEVRPEDSLFVKAAFEHYRPTELPIANGFHLGLGATF
jgi:hypothetical protein